MNPETLLISSELKATSDKVAIVREGLHRFNFVATGLTQVNTVALAELWLADACRRRGFGGELLDRAESEASRVGARGAFLSTFDFQAPEFYKSRGYEVYGALTGYPPGHTEYHLRKRFKL